MDTSLACATTRESQNNAIAFYQPRYRISRSDDSTKVEVELPGVTKDKLHISVENHELVLEGLVDGALPENWRALRRESVDRNYQLRLRIGDQIDQSAIDASLVNGVLTLLFPKAAAAKPRKIKIA